MNTPHMPGSHSRATLQSTTGRIAAVATALLLVLFLVLSVSRAAFTASTDNTGNSAETAGLVTLTDNDAGTALFTFAGDGTLLPGNEVERCVLVRYEGEFDSGTVRMHVPQAGVDSDLAPYLQVKIESEEVVTLPSAAELIALGVPGVTDVDLLYTEDATHDCTVFDVQDAAAVGNSPVVFDDRLSEFATSYLGDLTDPANPINPGEEPAAADDQFKATAGTTTFAYKVTISVANDPQAGAKSAAWDFIWSTHTDI